MLRRRCFVVLVAFAVAAVGLLVPALAAAQIGRAPRPGYSTDPAYWVGLSIGYMDGTTVSDGDTGSSWQFGYTSQIRATIEKTIQRGVTIGAGAGFANAPLTYVPGFVDPRAGCVSSCQATANVTQLMAFVRGSGGVGFHLLYELEAGLTQFSNFRVRSSDATLPPDNAQYDFSFGFGGGIGYGFSPTTEAFVDQVADLVLHSSGNTTSSSAPRFYTFRAGLRIGF